MYKLEFTLKQHTPLIHFQHDQAGATLRATEVKPKLDKFIITKLGKEELEKTKPDATNEEKFTKGKEIAKAKGWLIGNGEHAALDYKIQLRTANLTHIEIAPPILNNNGEYETNNQGKVKTKSYPLYFGNMGKEPTEISEIKSGIKSSVNLKILSFQSDLFHFISSNQLICQFFFVENFGTRQSKGYGCFYPVDENGNNFPMYYSNDIEPIKFSIDLSTLERYIDLTITGAANTRPNATDEYRLFKALEIFYQFLRNGINYPVDRQKLYVKPAIFHYARSLNQQWDKKSIKQKFFNGIRTNQATNHLSPEVLTFNATTRAEDGYDFKDLLGFSSEEAWRETNSTPRYYLDPGQKIEKSFTVKYIDSNGRNQQESDLTRLKSPLRFHIIQQSQDSRIFNIWFWCNEIPHEYLNAKTTFLKGNTGVTLQLPMFNSFNCINFINLIFRDQKNGSFTHALDAFSIPNNQRNAPHYLVLHSICESIKNNLL